MINGLKVTVVLPAYNAEKTLFKTYSEIPMDIVDDVILVDDHSRDNTAEISRKLGVTTYVHEQNRGYGGNQKTCYKNALARGADIVIMLHPDYQYTPKLIPVIAHMIASGLYDVVLGSRILGGKALAGGMPVYKYIANRFLTLIQNLLQQVKLSEYHTGYRAYHRKVLEKVPWQNNSDDFIFDNQFLAQILFHNFQVGEVSCPTKYFEEASSINFKRSVRYGIGCLVVAAHYRLARWGLLAKGLFRSLPVDISSREVSS